MSVAKVTEITSESSESFDKAIEEGIARAAKTLKNIKSAWVSEQHLTIENGKIVPTTDTRWAEIEKEAFMSAKDAFEFYPELKEL